jgi:hypothetical protein
MMLEPAAERWVDSGHRFVKEQERGIRHQATGYLEQTFLPSTEVTGIFILFISKLEPCEQVTSSFDK